MEKLRSSGDIEGKREQEPMYAKATKDNEKQPEGRNHGAGKGGRLTARQLRAIPLIVTSPTYTAGCKRARINKTTLYKWLKVEAFKTELEHQRHAVTQDAQSGQVDPQPLVTDHTDVIGERDAGLVDGEGVPGRARPESGLGEGVGPPDRNGLGVREPRRIYHRADDGVHAFGLELCDRRGGKRSARHGNRGKKIRPGSAG